MKKKPLEDSIDHPKYAKARHTAAEAERPEAAAQGQTAKHSSLFDHQGKAAKFAFPQSMENNVKRLFCFPTNQDLAIILT